MDHSPSGGQCEGLLNTVIHFEKRVCRRLCYMLALGQNLASTQVAAFGILTFTLDAEDAP